MYIGSTTYNGSTTAQGATVYVSLQWVPMAPPACNACNTIATRQATEDGRYWCDACLDAHNRRVAIECAENWLTAAFIAVKREARARLFKSLAAAFHPDTGGDPDLMVALNRVRDRFPS